MTVKILVVDSVANVRQNLQSSLELEGYDVSVATSGEEALDVVTRDCPDILLLDVLLPGIDGIEVLLQLKKREETRDIAVIMVTADARDDKVVASLELGATDFIPKPYSDTVVRARVRHVLRVRNLQRRKQREKEDVEAASELKATFLANMSHEICTPMTAILGFADLLYSEGDITKAPQHRIHAIATIKRNAEYLLDLIGDTLDLSKLEAGKIDVERHRCSAVQVLAEVVSLMRVRADEKDLPLEVKFMGSIPETVHTDPTRLRQILINLVSNAIRFTETGGVHIRIQLLDAHIEEPSLEFRVIDTGIGLTPEQVNRIFQPFVQANTYTARTYGGTGLGLTISKHLAELLGGTISVESLIGQGTTFSLTIETGSLEGVRLLDETDGTDHESSHELFPESPDQDALDCRILLVENGPDSQRLLSYVLTRSGAEVTLAENGEMAVDLALTAQADGKPFDVILMGMQMPVMDGFRATRLLRSQGYDHPIIALTARSMMGDRQKCLDAGCDDYATKPINRKKLIDLLAKYSQAIPEEPTATV